MNYYHFLSALGLTILLPAVAALLRHRRAEAAYLPFLILLWAGAVTEVCSVVIVYTHGDNLFLYNVFLLAEFWLLLWQFRRWGLFDGRDKLSAFLLAAGSAWWLAEGFVLDSLERVNSYFLLGSSFVMVVLSILAMGRLLIFVNYRLLHHARFLICLGLLVYFAFSILVEAYLLFGITASEVFQVNVSDIMYYINAIVNLLFTYSVLCIPTRLQFMGQR